MNVARLNFSHGTHAEHKQVIDLIKRVRQEAGVPLAIMLDTKGPEIRLRKIAHGELYLPIGHHWKLVKEEVVGTLEHATLTPAAILPFLKPGMRLLFDDGYIAGRVIRGGEDAIEIVIENGGLIRSGKGVNVPEVAFALPAITEQDIADIQFGCREEVDIIAASFVRSADDVLAIRKILAQEKGSRILVTAKIENKEGVKNFDSILQVADGIMIARGDLGVQLPLSEVPRLQKLMIKKSYLAGKPAVTATQMLESMINNPRPTRAEASDVANAIYDSTAAVMLSGETAIGKFPIEVVQTMREIVEKTEADFDYQEFFFQHSSLVYHDVPSALTLAAVKTAYTSHAQSIFAFTHSGATACLLSRLRPKMSILAMTPDEKSYHQLAFSWGVTPVLGPYCQSLAEAMAALTHHAIERKYVSVGDLVIVTAGDPFGVSGTTNMMMVENIGDVLVRAHAGIGQRVYGNVVMLASADSRPTYTVRDMLLVIPRCDSSYEPLIREAVGVILHNHIQDLDSEKQALALCRTLHKPCVVRADGAQLVLKEGQLVTLDPDKALIYKGVVL